LSFFLFVICQCHSTFIKEQEAEIKAKEKAVHDERDKILQSDFTLRNEQTKLKNDIEGK
jgi:hypothetical protein